MSRQGFNLPLLSQIHLFCLFNTRAVLSPSWLQSPCQAGLCRAEGAPQEQDGVSRGEQGGIRVPAWLHPAPGGVPSQHLPQEPDMVCSAGIL